MAAVRKAAVFIWMGMLPPRRYRRPPCRLFLMQSIPVGRAHPPLTLSCGALSESRTGGGDWQAVVQHAPWDPAQTAMMICDMWNRRRCRSASACVAGENWPSTLESKIETGNCNCATRSGSDKARCPEARSDAA